MKSSGDDWFYISSDGKRQGPVPRATLLSLHLSGELTSDTRVWSRELVDWQVLSSVFAGEIPPPLPSADNPELTSPSTRETEVDQSHTFFGGSHHPWRRYFAKSADLLIIGALPVLASMTILGFVFAAVKIAPEQVQRLAKLMGNPIVDGLLVVAFWALLESILLSRFGTTPARWVFGIRVTDTAGRRLRFGQAFSRALTLAIQGLGCGIPIVIFFTQYYGYKKLVKTGTTHWDVAARSVVTHSHWSPLRTVACVAFVFLALAVVSLVVS